MSFNHMYTQTDVCPISGEPIIQNFTRPGGFQPDGFVYKIPGYNNNVIIVIPNNIMSNDEVMKDLSRKKETFLKIVKEGKENPFIVGY